MILRIRSSGASKRRIKISVFISNKGCNRGIFSTFLDVSKKFVIILRPTNFLAAGLCCSLPCHKFSARTESKKHLQKKTPLLFLVCSSKGQVTSRRNASAPLRPHRWANWTAPPGGIRGVQPTKQQRLPVEIFTRLAHALLAKACRSKIKGGGCGFPSPAQQKHAKTQKNSKKMNKAKKQSE